MADGLQKAIDICFVMFDPRLPSGDGALRGAFNSGTFFFRRWIIWILGNNDIIDSIFDDVCEKMLKALRRGIQAASCVGPGKSNLPFELRRKAGDFSRVTAGPIDLI